VGHRADLWNLRTTYKLKLQHLTEEGADQAAASERQNKKKKPNHLARLQQRFCLNTTPGLDDGGVTPKPKLRLKFYCS
jgi:hypothetical protein